MFVYVDVWCCALCCSLADGGETKYLRVTLYVLGHEGLFHCLLSCCLVCERGSLVEIETFICASGHFFFTQLMFSTRSV